MTPKELAKADQVLSMIADMLPPVWWNLFDGCIEKGFTRDEALSILKTYIATTLRPNET